MKCDLTVSEVLQAYYDCRRNKRNTMNALIFEEDLERNLIELYDELINNTYYPGQSICFVVEYPKVREVWASNFRDRVVHHILYNRYSQRFHNSFIHDSYACIPGKGTLAAADRLQHFMRSASLNNTKETWYLKADVANFFMSINKNILDTILTKKITDPWWMNLTRIILHHNPTTDVYVKSDKKLLKTVPYHKSLFHADGHHGLPIGNLSSQFFANVYLNELDQYAKHTLKLTHYIRYVDDIVVLGNNGGVLDEKYNLLNTFAQNNLELEMHPNKKSINKIEHGANFVGYIVKPYCRYLRRSIIDNMYKRTRPGGDNEDMYHYRGVVNSYLGMLKHVNSYNERVKFAKNHPDLFFDEDFLKMMLVPKLDIDKINELIGRK
jgi:retron-type reverse transcriptase